MKKIVFATHNQHKTEEVRKMLPMFEVLNLTDIGCHEDIPETGDSFAANAQLKSDYVFEHFGLDCFADDSGLEVEALNQEPGIFSARYSGVKDDQTNLVFLLDKLRGIVNRNARFKTVISLKQGDKQLFFEGVIQGVLREEPAGNQGFGYDPIFQPEGYGITFAEMDMAMKNQISHRALAVQQLITYLQAPSFQTI